MAFLLSDSPFLTRRTEPKELKFVGHTTKTVTPADFLFQFVNQAVFKLHYARALLADQVVVMPIITLSQQFKPGHAIPELIPFYHSHGLQQIQGTVNGSQVATLWQSFMDVPNGKWMILLAK